MRGATPRRSTGTRPRRDVPLWARQMEIFILEDMNELEAARIMLGGLLGSGEIQRPGRAALPRAAAARSSKSRTQSNSVSALDAPVGIPTFCGSSETLFEYVTVGTDIAWHGVAISSRSPERTQGERHMKTMQTGFTLVEIAIVLVIIGLLLGGILKGQEMITQAKIKNVIADFSGVSAAYYGYQDRYRALPGDDQTRGDALDRSASGDTATATASSPARTTRRRPTDESRMFWDHLRRAGFVSGTGAEQPFNAASRQDGRADRRRPPRSTGHAARTRPAGTGFVGLIMCSANLPDKIAIAVDYADGRRRRRAGTVRGVLQTAANPPIGVALEAAANYEEPAPTST